MPIIGFNIKSIHAYIDDKKVEGPIDVNSAPVIESVRKKDLNIPGMKEILSIEFHFTTRYDPKIGEISITGEVLYQAEDTKKVLSMWKEKKLESSLAVDVLNTIFKKCLTKSVGIADELRLPPPLNFPVVKGEPSKEIKKEKDEE